MKSQKVWIIISGVTGFLGVAFGAFAAHILKSQITNEMLKIYETGILYQLVHSAVMLSVALSGNQRILKSEIFFFTGIILFSFSLYIYSITSIKFFAMITPVGGIFLLTGWVSLIFYSLQSK